MMLGTHRVIAAFASVLSSVFWVGNAWSDSLDVRWDGKVLCVGAKDASRGDVLREVAHKTGAKISGAEQLTDRVTLKPTCADLGSSLRVLAGSAGYALTELAPRQDGTQEQYALFIAARGRANRQRNLMANHPAVSVLVEDPVTGEMHSSAAPSAVSVTTNLRPDAVPVSVRVDLE